MRQAVLYVFAVAAAVVMAGCGGGSSSSSTAGVPNSITAQSVLSLTVGEVATVNATVIDSSGNAATNAKSLAFSSGNAALVTINPTSGSACAGTWDTNYIVCTPGPTGTTTITIKSGDLSATVNVYVHKKVDRVTVAGTGACRSMGQTLQLTASAFSAGQDITSTVGPFFYAVSPGTIATIDANGLLTAQVPGAGSVYASVASVASVPSAYSTCPVRSIHVHVQNGTATSFTLAGLAATQQLVADVVDTAGNTISPPLFWISSRTPVATVSSSPAGLVTATAPGTTSVTAACSAGCNFNVPPVYGDVAVGTVSGTSATTVWVGGTGSTQFVPIDTATNTAGTAVTLQSQPNSILFAENGSKVLLGSGGGLMSVDASVNTSTQTATYPGKVLAISHDGVMALVADTNAVYSAAQSASATSETLSIAGATAADWAIDNSKAYIVAGSTIYVYVPGRGVVTSYPLIAAPTDVKFLPSGAFAYFANSAPSAISARATCNEVQVDSQATPSAPVKLGVTPDALKTIAVDGSGIDVVTRTSTSAGCPPAVAETLASFDFGLGSFTAKQLLVLADGSKAYVISNLGKLLVFDVASGTSSTITLANGATPLSMGATLDSATLYVGGSDNAVHRIVTSTGTDAQQITVAFTPDLVAVRPK